MLLWLLSVDHREDTCKITESGSGAKLDNNLGAAYPESTFRPMLNAAK
jgi:hypothetical protein